VIQILAQFIRLILLCFLVSSTIVLLVVGIRRKGKELPFKKYFVLASISAVLSLAIGSFSLTSQQTNNRENCVPSFERNFGFRPPERVTEIKLKDFAFYDAVSQWMCFTYDSAVFAQIIAADSNLSKEINGTTEFNNSLSKLQKGKGNHPKWLALPNKNTPIIFTKNDYLLHTHSQYYLWADTSKKLAFLEVSYFD
jgi:hypothetical protein